MLAENLEKVCGVGPHTISVPRLREAEGVDIKTFPYIPTDEQFLRVIATLRVATPYTGMIISTRETPETRRKELDLGISQCSAGSCTGIGGYHKEIGQPDSPDTAQFKISDTACYRQGRTGDRFMSLAKSGQIRNICQPNAILTFKEYLIGYGSDHLKELGEKVIAKEVEQIPSERVRELTKERLKKLEEGAQDLYF